MSSAAPSYNFPSNPKPIAKELPISVPQIKPTKELNPGLTISLINEEVSSFHSEIQLLLTRCKQVEINVGTDEDKSLLVKRCRALSVYFIEALRETTETQMNEIFDLKRQLLEIFALKEEAVSRFKRLTNPHYLQLYQLQTNDMDPVRPKKLTDINRLLYYVDSQLKQVDLRLDEEWNESQDAQKRSMRYTTPTMEAIYRPMIKQSEIIRRQTFLLKDLKARIKARNLKKSTIPLIQFKGGDDTLEDSVKKLNISINPNDVLVKKFQLIESSGMKVSKVKEDQLRKFLLGNKLVKISPSKPKQQRIRPSVLPVKMVKSPVESKKVGNFKIMSMATQETTPIAITKIIDNELKGMN